MVLILLAILIAGLAVLAAVSPFVPPRAVTSGKAGAAGAIALMAVAALLIPSEPTTFVLPTVEPVRLALDPMGASFLLLLGIAAAARTEGGPLGLAGTALAMIAANGFTLIIGVIVMVSARWNRHSPGSVAGRGGGDDGDSERPITGSLHCASIASLSIVFALLGHHADFPSIRSALPDTTSTAAVVPLMLIAAGVLLTTAPLLAGYLLLRVLFDLGAPAQSAICAFLPLIGGAALAVAMTARAALADTIHDAVSAAALQQFGLATVALGIALLARAADLPSLATLALQGLWLSLACLTLCRALLLGCADAVESGTGTRGLDKLGGLIHRMPTTSLCSLTGLFALVIVPPGLGFAAFWHVFQSLLGAARVVGITLQLAFVLAAAALALSAGLAALAAVRMFGVACLGRPRTPRTAVAEEASRSVRIALTGLAILTAMLGFVPGLALLPALGWTGGDAIALNTRPGYSASVIAILLAFSAAGALWIRAGFASGEQRQEAAWMSGFAAPPPWLPFGDPATQASARSFAAPLKRFLALPARGWLADWQRRCVAILSRGAAALAVRGVDVTLLVIVLAFIAWLVVS